jgi:class 3 adenylate cyclase
MAVEPIPISVAPRGFPGGLPPLLRAGLDTLSFGFAIFDRDLKLVVCNRAFRTLRGYPATLCKRGTELIEFYRFNAKRGADGKQGSDAAHCARQHARRTGLHRSRPERRCLQRSLCGNVSGAARAASAGRPYPEFLRFLAEHGYYGDGDVAAMVARRVDSLRNPSDKAFEDRTPDGRIYRIARRRAASGGTVTVMTDVTELKEAERSLLAAIARSEEANQRVNEQNRTLVSLSSKLSKYLSPQLYKSIFSGEKNVEVASQRKKLTIFFSDIAGFTETTDMLESEELTTLLNQYLREMSAIALDHGATIDKFIGDAIMLFFGDPESRGARATSDRMREDGDRHAATDAGPAGGMARARPRACISASHRDQHGLLHRWQFRQR